MHTKSEKVQQLDSLIVKKFNNFAGSGGLGMIIDDFNGDNFDHTDLDFIHGGMIILGQTGLRPIANNSVPSGTPILGCRI